MRMSLTAIKESQNSEFLSFLVQQANTCTTSAHHGMKRRMRGSVKVRRFDAT